MRRLFTTVAFGTERRDAVEPRFVVEKGISVPLVADAKLLPLITYAAETDLVLWLELDEADELTDARVPVEGLVTALEEQAQFVRVTIEPSQLDRVLRKDNSRFDELLAKLKSAHEQNRAVLIAENDDHDIEDVSDPFDLATHALIEPAPPATVVTDLPYERVQEIFDEIKAFDCGGKPAGSTCIPFKYPDDGCWGRAHRMAQIAQGKGVPSRKVWIYGSLRVSTANNPRCSVGWRYHVAICLEVNGQGTHVLDPSMFDAPVPLAKWTRAQSDPTPSVHQSDSAIFYRPPAGHPLQYDPQYRETERVLRTYRAKLLERALKAGPPPYAHCTTSLRESR